MSSSPPLAPPLQSALTEHGVFLSSAEHSSLLLPPQHRAPAGINPRLVLSSFSFSTSCLSSYNHKLSATLIKNLSGENPQSWSDFGRVPLKLLWRQTKGMRHSHVFCSKWRLFKASCFLFIVYTSKQSYSFLQQQWHFILFTRGFNRQLRKTFVFSMDSQLTELTRVHEFS